MKIIEARLITNRAINETNIYEIIRKDDDEIHVIDKFEKSLFPIGNQVIKYRSNKTDEEICKFVKEKELIYQQKLDQAKSIKKGFISGKFSDELGTFLGEIIETNTKYFDFKNKEEQVGEIPLNTDYYQSVFKEIEAKKDDLITIIRFNVGKKIAFYHSYIVVRKRDDILVVSTVENASVLQVVQVLKYKTDKMDEEIVEFLQMQEKKYQKQIDKKRFKFTKTIKTIKFQLEFERLFGKPFYVETLNKRFK